MIDNALRDCDGQAAAELLSFNDAHVANPALQLESPDVICQRVLDQPYDELAAAHLRCCWAVANHNFMEAYAQQAVVAQAMIKSIQSQKEDNWSLPIMFSICLDLRIFAYNADMQAVKKNKGKYGERLEKAAEILMSFFRVCASDNRASIDDTKKWGMLYLVNQLFKIYFKINKLHLCKPLIRAIDNLPMKNKFSLSQLITFRYYVGRKAMFESDFKSAEEYLTFAFERCHRQCSRNKRMILIYLLPVKMLLGHMPQLSLLQKYNLLQFADVAQAVREPVIVKPSSPPKRDVFHQVWHLPHSGEAQDHIIQKSLQKIHLILNTHQLSVQAFTSALKFMQIEDIDNDETQCILANLIYENKIKGYISHQHQKLVVSKQNPFPPLS